MWASTMWTRKLLPFLLAPLFVVGQRILVDDLELSTNIGTYENPTDLKFTKDGTLWACDKRGILTVSSSGHYDSPRAVLDLTDVICDNGERGLLGVAPHFDFGEENPYVYVTYIFKKNGNCNENGNNGPVLRLSRFMCDTRGDLECDIDSEEVYLESPSFPFDRNNGGALAFGKDEMIYATIGDGGRSFQAQDRSHLFGTIVRLTPENTIPPDNPYSIQSGTEDSVRCGFNKGDSGSRDDFCQEIFAYGLQNPRPVAMNPNKATTEFYINDVGASLWEEVSEGGDGYVGADYGWPAREGPCRKGADCGGRVCSRHDQYIEPIHFYHHNDSGEGAITAGVFVPEGIWPSAYDQKYLYADFVLGGLFVMDSGGNEDRDSCPPTSSYIPTSIVELSNSEITAMAFNPSDGTLYFLTSDTVGGRLNRIRHSGSMNGVPQPKITTSTSGGDVGTTIEFDASESTDPDGHDLQFEWDFDGDGEIDSTKVIDSFTYNDAGIYEVVLKVRDGFGGHTSITTTIGIGAQPIAVILDPEDGSDFYVGQEIILTGEMRGEDSNENDESFLWEVKLHNGKDSRHYLELTTGNPVPLPPAPSPEDFEASENSYLEVILTVTNNFGLNNTVSRIVMPRLRYVSLSSVPEGRAILVDDYEIITPINFTSWAKHHLKVEATDEDWVQWSNGGNRSQVVTLSEKNDDPVLLTALFATTEAPITGARPMTPAPSTMAPTLRFGFENRPPVAIINASALGGNLGTTINFDATGSADSDGNKLSFEWDFDGDGVIDSNQSISSFRYNQSGIFVVSLFANDGRGAVSTATVEIGIDVYPNATILEPREGSQFYVGEVLVLKGSASGEGVLNENESMAWTVNHHVANFYSPHLLETVGNDIQIPPAPKPHPLIVAMESYLEVTLKVTNKFGMSTTVSRRVMPITINFAIVSFPQGRFIRIDDFYFVSTPASFVSWANQEIRVQAVDDDFHSWSNGGEQEHDITLPQAQSSSGDGNNYTLIAFFEYPVW